MYPVEDAGREALAPLFESLRYFRPMVEGALQGRFGSAVVDARRRPRVAALYAYPYAVLGGDPASATARELIRQLPDHARFVVADDRWQEAVAAAHPRRHRAEDRLAFSSESLDRSRLDALAADVPPGFEIRRLDAETARRLPDEVAPHSLGVYRVGDELVRSGVAFGVFREGRLVGAATSAAASDTAIEIQIDTNEPFRRRGLATAVAATLISDCLERGIDPNWDTASAASEGLAQKLGYTPAGRHRFLVF
jgi:RimJ/RimL family protein N-acetyltransferase